MMTILLMPLFLESIMWSFDVVLNFEPLDKILTYDQKNQSPQLHIYEVSSVLRCFQLFRQGFFLNFVEGLDFPSARVILNI